MATVQGAGIISGPLSGGLSDRIGRRPLIAAGMVSSSVLLILLMVLRVEWLFILVLALIGFFLYSTSPVLNAWALDIAPPHLGGTSIGILFASQSLLGGIAPVLGGYIADRVRHRDDVLLHRRDGAAGEPDHHHDPRRPRSTADGDVRVISGGVSRPP